MEVTLIMIGFILCALASFAGAFFGVRSLSEEAKPLRIPIYADIKEAAERKREEGNAADSRQIMKEYFWGGETDD